MILASNDVVRQDFDGHGAVEPHVAGFVDLAHLTGPDCGEDFVGPEFVTGRQRHVGISVAQLSRNLTPKPGQERYRIHDFEAEARFGRQIEEIGIASDEAIDFTMKRQIQIRLILWIARKMRPFPPATHSGRPKSSRDQSLLKASLPGISVIHPPTRIFCPPR